MNSTKVKPANILIVLVLLLLAAFSVYFFVLRNTLAPSDTSAANTGKLVLKLASPSTLVDQPVNTNFTVNLSAQNIESDKVAEIILNFDAASLEGVSVTEDTTLLALNKNINNTTGVITIDVAQSGASAFTADKTLVTFAFKIKNNSAQSTTLSLAQGSTLGYPNRIASDGYGSLILNFKSVVTISCGDGVKAGAEQCDDGTNNGKLCQPGYNSTCNYCSASCTTITLQGNKCGDGVVGGSEQCDSATNNGKTCQPDYGSTCNYCSSTCTTTTLQGAKCGDGVKNGAEQCDDGNQNASDSCTNQCITNAIGAPGITPDPEPTVPADETTNGNTNTNTNTGSSTGSTNTSSNTGTTNNQNGTGSTNTNTDSTTGSTSNGSNNNNSSGSSTTTSGSGTNTPATNKDPIVNFLAGLFPAKGTSNTLLIALLAGTVISVIALIGYVIKLVFFYKPSVNPSNPFTT